MSRQISEGKSLIVQIGTFFHEYLAKRNVFVTENCEKQDRLKQKNKQPKKELNELSWKN